MKATILKIKIQMTNQRQSPKAKFELWSLDLICNLSFGFCNCSEFQV